MTEYARRSARILLIDGEDRLLLFCYDYEPGTRGRGWFTPGGGVEDGEGLAETAVRELFEETGLAVTVDELGPHVAVSEGVAQLGWVNGRMRDDLFVHRVDRHDVETGGMLGYEIASVRGHKWWSVAELRETDETVFPLQLADLIERLVGGDIPAEPVTLPWDH